MRRFKRDKDHRRALMINLTKSLIKHKAIKTTVSKAKDLKIFAERILTKSKTNDLHSKRVIAGILMNDWDIVNELFNNITPKIQNRQGGYTRILKLGLRKGDGAMEVLIELVDLPKTSTTPKVTAAVTEEKTVASKVAEEVTVE